MRDDNRAVSTVIGVVILFGFLIISLSLYQVDVVPQQNAETEFQHSEDVRNDLVELRAGILQAGSIDQPQYQTVQLGTTYSTRVFSINPPAPAGTIRTSKSYPITIVSNETVIETIPTRFIEYQPGYNELDRSPTRYDASVLYFDAREEGGGIAVVEDQALFDDGEVQVTALQNEFRRSGTGRVTLELRPAENVTGDIPDGDLTVTVPTRLSNEEYWNRTEIPNNKYSITDDTNGDGVYNLTLETTTSNLTVDTVGVQEAPEEPTQNDAARVGGNGGASDDGESGNEDPLSYQQREAGTDGELGFTATNFAGDPITVTGFSVNATRINDKARLDNERNTGSDDREVVIAPQNNGQLGFGDRDGDGNNPAGRYEADGTLYMLDKEAIIQSGENVEITFVAFRKQNGKVINFDLRLRTDPAAADVTVRLQYENRPDQLFYFEDVS